MKDSELNSVINALKPARVDELADAAYERRPDAALIRARAGTSTVNPRLVRDRRPTRRLAYATGATAAVAATALLAAGALSGGHQGAREASTDTRTFLLASAETAAKQPATSGTCWYTRTRRWQEVPIPARTSQPVHVPMSTSERRAHAFQALTANSTEDWRCTLPGGTGMRFRTHGPLDTQFTFPTKKNEAAWRAAGSPPLTVNGGTTVSKPFTTTYEKGSHLVNPDIGSHKIEWKTIATLPATKSGLEGYLRKLWQQDRTGGANGYVAPADFGLYVFESAGSLFDAPTTPGTRAALYRILADFPAVHITGRITDREGRSGMAITAQTPDGVVGRLVIDPATAQLLDYQEFGGHAISKAAGGGVTGDEYVAFERQAWVNRIGALPTSR